MKGGVGQFQYERGRSSVPEVLFGNGTAACSYPVEGLQIAHIPQHCAVLPAFTYTQLISALFLCTVLCYSRLHHKLKG